MGNDALEEIGRLGDDGLRELLARMVSCARRIAAGKPWAGSNPLGTAAGLEDFVAGTLEAVLCGDRPWSRAAKHGLNQHLFQCLKSEIDNLAKAADNATRAVLPEAEEHAAPNLIGDGLVARKRFAEAASRELFAAAGEDEVLKSIADLFLEGYEATDDFAAKLNVPKERINAALQKLRRRLNSAGTLPRLKEMIG